MDDLLAGPYIGPEMDCFTFGSLHVVVCIWWHCKCGVHPPPVAIGGTRWAVVYGKRYSVGVEVVILVSPSVNTTVSFS